MLLGLVTSAQRGHQNPHQNRGASRGVLSSEIPPHHILVGLRPQLKTGLVMYISLFIPMTTAVRNDYEARVQQKKIDQRRARNARLNLPVAARAKTKVQKFGLLHKFGSAVLSFWLSTPPKEKESVKESRLGSGGSSGSSKRLKDES